MSDVVGPGPSAPRPPGQTQKKPPRARFFARLGLGGGRSRQSSASALIKSIKGNLPETDPLRRSRLQAHLFMGELPSFPTPKKEVTPPGTSATMAAMRADKVARAEARAEEEAAKAADPGHQRAQSLKQERANRQAKAGGTQRPASSLRKTSAVGRAGSAQARKAAERSPARAAVSQISVSSSGLHAQGTSSANGLNSLLILIMFISLAAFVGISYIGYRWYQQLNSEAQIETPVSTDLFDSSGAGEAQTGTTLLDPSVDASNNGETLVEDGGAGIDPTPEQTPEQLAAARFEASVLLLEQELANDRFLDQEFVDGLYDAQTEAALRVLFGTLSLPELDRELLATFGQPTQEQVDRWYQEIEPLL